MSDDVVAWAVRYPEGNLRAYLWPPVRDEDARSFARRYGGTVVPLIERPALAAHDTTEGQR